MTNDLNHDLTDSALNLCREQRDKAEAERDSALAECKAIQAKYNSVAAEAARLSKVTDEIKDIMRVYREQEASPYGVGTPGGLEHMGDVWRLLAKWDRLLSSTTPVSAELEAKAK